MKTSARPSIRFVAFGDVTSTLSLRARNLSKGLRDRGWDSEVILLGQPTSHVTKPAAGDVATEGVFLVSSSGAKGICHAVMRIRLTRPSFIHFLNPMTKALIISRLAGPSRVIGDWEDWHTNPDQPTDRRWSQRLADRFLIRSCDVVLTCSRWLQEEFSHRFNRSDIHYLPYACHPHQTIASENPFHQPTAVFMGAFHPYWNHRVILEAAALLKQRGQTPAIVLIGTGADLEPCRVWAAERELWNVRFTGFLPDEEMHRFLRHAHVLLFPFEDNLLNRARCPFKVFQYAQSRRPVITSPIGEVASLLADKAIYCQSNPGSFADRLASIMASPRPADVNYELEQHTWDARAATLEQVLFT